ncbi:CheY-like chemotaxis protein [Aquimarina sp. EL_43]|nr:MULTISPECIES: response regulator [Aquimarina]MBG6129664.1 CheY-like chemotaxis protein [Aquimarina sp. EL_35]MBG6150729.1 CheY-like chemotaxis protein [Aquimarina sp. EL_32]MBG6167964.1 CheY-like chemotaxis protein [Aquimarina sp. EL_43]
MIYYAIGGVLLVMLLFLYIQYKKVTKKLKKKNIELKSLSKETEKQFQLQQNLISILSQELRTPLYGIMGLTNLLEEEYPDLKNDKNLKSLKFSGDYLFTLINNVLHVNFLDSEEITVQNVLFDIKEVTQNLTHSFSYATENSDNILHFEFDPEIDQMIYGDPGILSQILMNLISNALRFTKNGNVYFSVILIKKKENISTISFKINHDGDELSKEDKKSIYQEFINVGNAKKTYLGTGINSKIINRLASALDGEIIIQNNSHVGSEYALVIDFKSQVNKEGINHNTSFNNSNTSKLKVLIVDDNKLNLLVADKILSKENFDCTTIDNGFDAIELVRENEYNVILMDINMPKLNGIGTTKRIREFDTKTPIIALTAVDVTQLNRQIVQAGLNDYILKPYNKNHLLEMIHRHVDNPIHTH